jgi:DNA-binding MarR family transcriptional regulator
LVPGKAVNDLSAPLSRKHDSLPAARRLITAQSLVEEWTVSLNTMLHPTTLKIYRTLAHLALEVARHRAYSPKVTQVSFHLPAEVLACELGVHRSTLWRQLKPLAQRGLIDHRPHKTTLKGQTRNDGTLWAIKLFPTRGKRARLSHEEMKHPWRDLEGDIRKGRTAFRFMQQSKNQGKVNEG